MSVKRCVCSNVLWWIFSWCTLAYSWTGQAQWGHEGISHPWRWGRDRVSLQGLSVGSLTTEEIEQDRSNSARKLNLRPFLAEQRAETAGIRIAYTPPRSLGGGIFSVYWGVCKGPQHGDFSVLVGVGAVYKARPSRACHTPSTPHPAPFLLVGTHSLHHHYELFLGSLSQIFLAPFMLGLWNGGHSKQKALSAAL